MIGFEQTTYSVEEGLQVEVCVIVINSTLSRETVVTLSSSDNDWANNILRESGSTYMGTYLIQ